MYISVVRQDMVVPITLYIGVESPVTFLGLDPEYAYILFGYGKHCEQTTAEKQFHDASEVESALGPSGNHSPKPSY